MSTRGPYAMFAIHIGLQVLRAAFLCDVGSVVRLVEEIVHFDDPIGRHAVSKPEPPLQSQVDTVDRVPGEAVARHDGTVRPQAVAGVGADISQVTAVARVVSLAGTVEVEATQLEGIADVPDAIEDEPVTLVA